MKKRWVFTGAAAFLAVVFLAGVLAVGGSTSWFGFEKLAGSQLEDWRYEYQTTWDPAVSSVDGIKINWSNGPVYIQPTQDSLITVTEYSQRPLGEEERLKLTSSGRVLKIQWDHNLLPLGLFQDLEKRLVVEVPQELASQLEELSCGNVTGEIHTSGVTAEELNLSSGSGSLYLSSLQSEDAKVSTVSGDIQWVQSIADSLSARTSSGALRLVDMRAKKCRMENVTGDLEFQGQGEEFDVETISGPVRMKLSTCPKEADLRSVSGGLSLTVPENDGFQAEYSSVSGKFTSEFEGTREKGRLHYGKGQGKFRFATTSGDMAVRRGQS